MAKGSFEARICASGTGGVSLQGTQVAFRGDVHDGVDEPDRYNLAGDGSEGVLDHPLDEDQHPLPAQIHRPLRRGKACTASQRTSWGRIGVSMKLSSRPWAPYFEQGRWSLRIKNRAGINGRYRVSKDPDLLESRADEPKQKRRGKNL